MPPEPVSRAGKTVLLGWELGAGFGHVRPMGRVAAALAADGHRPVLALRDVVNPWPAVRDLPWPVLVAPTYVHQTAGRRRPTATMADILGLHGYGSVETLAPLVRAWDGILASVLPDLVVADYAPTLTLAAAGRVPIVGIGSGFTQPPTHLSEFPKLDPDRPPLVRQADLLGIVRKVQEARGGPVPLALPNAFVKSATCLTIYPELDPYRDYRRESVVGPLDAMPPPLAWPAEPRFFAYLVAGIASTEPGLLALARAGLSGEVYIRGADAGLTGRLREAGLTVHDTPPSLPDVFTRTRALLHQGGLQTSMTALAAGRPQMILPTHLEQMLNAVNVYALGAAHYLSAEYPVADLIDGVKQLIHDPRFERRAADLARHYRRVGLTNSNGLAKVIDACRVHLG